MHNWYAMEVEAESRRQEWERTRMAADRAAEAECAAAGRGRISAFRFFRPQVSLAQLRSLVAPVATSPRPVGC